MLLLNYDENETEIKTTIRVFKWSEERMRQIINFTQIYIFYPSDLSLLITINKGC